MDKKFVSTKNISDYEILTDDGYKDVVALHKTIDYEVYNLILDDKELKCADNHIVFLENDKEIFVKNLNIGDKIKTINGVQEVVNIEKCGYEKEMWDFELSDDNCKYYTNGILSHNTYFLRYLLQKLSKTKKKVLYFPPTMIEVITDPAFFNFITTWTMDNGKNSVLLIEDAEPLLMSRESGRNMGITNLLNLTDGILNDILSIQIIATFNTHLSELDKALLRPERLIARKEFKKLPKEDALKLGEILKIDSSLITREMSLAEIYSIKNNNDILTHGVDMKSGERYKIGFSNKK
jgi:hypothetical protein